MRTFMVFTAGFTAGILAGIATALLAEKELIDPVLIADDDDLLTADMRKILGRDLVSDSANN